MGERINHPKWGSAYRRVFPGIAWDSKLEQDLQSAEASGDLFEFQYEAGNLVVLRRWVEEKDLRGIFREAKDEFSQRRGFARDVFNILIGQFGERAHGAVQPANLFRVDGRPALLDWVANAARLQTAPESATIYDVWLWHPQMPTGWAAGDWDRVNLLRMVTLLEQGPPHWDEPLPFLDMVQLCRDWAETYLSSLTIGDSLGPKLQEVLRLLDLLQPPPLLEVERLSQLEDELDMLIKRQHGDHMLRPGDEKSLRAKYGDDLLAVAMQLKDVEPQEDVKKTARDFLRAGVYEEGRRSVRSSACRNAERIFHGLGVSPDKAETMVKEILAAENLEDSRALQDEWRLEVEEYLRQHCGRGRQYSRRQLGKMVKLVAKFDIPEKWAQLQLRQYLDQNSARMKQSSFGM